MSQAPDAPNKELDELEIPEGADKEKLNEIVRKDSATGRAMTGFWKYVTSALGVFMVLFYFYAAGVSPISTQYFNGTYVLITYVLVFICYPFQTASSQRNPLINKILLAARSGILVAFWAIVYAPEFFSVFFGGAEPSGGYIKGLYFLAFTVLHILIFPFWHTPRNDRPSIYDLILAAVSVAVVGYWIIEFEALNYRMGMETQLDSLVSWVGILISLEVSRRVLGWPITLMGTTLIAFCLFGPYLPDLFAHRGFSLERTVTHIYLKQEGVFGIMADVLVTYVILFIFFGAFLKKSGAGKFFLDLPMALAGRTVGGPAKVAVLASGFFGSVSGSAIANTVSTGAFTIPLMKSAGFKKHVAGAIEPAASIGGMFMPPIMGAGGFLMAELTETPYVEIMKIAIFPAVIYFLSVFAMIHFEAKRYGLVGVRDPNAPSAWQILKKEWYMSLPLVIIVAMMLMDFSPGNAAFWATISCVVVSWFSEDYKMGPKEIMEAMIEGANNTLVIGATVGVIGIIVGAIALTGIGLRFSDIIISLSQGVLPVAILLIGLASLVLGMGVPVTAAYLITAVLAVPAISGMVSATWVAALDVPFPLDGAMAMRIFGTLDPHMAKEVLLAIDPGITKLVLANFDPGLITGALANLDPKAAADAFLLIEPDMAAQVAKALPHELGIHLMNHLDTGIAPDVLELVRPKMAVLAVLACHMGVYWFSQDSNITPPVCVAAYAGAAIAGSDPWKTGWTSFKFAKMLYAGPFLFAYSPGFLMGGSTTQIIFAYVTIVLGTIAFSSCTMGYLLCGTNIVEWLLMALATLLLLFPKVVPWGAEAMNIDLSWMPMVVVDIAGIAIWFLVYLMQKVRIKNDPNLTLSVDDRKGMKEVAA